VKAALLILAALLSGCAPKRAYVEMTPERLLQFHQHYSPLFRKMFACPESNGTLDDCRGARFGVVDQRELQQAREVGIF
jgi:hypothetical protein